MDDGFDYMRILLMEIYERLYGAYGPQHWWPGETAFEMMVGAILTQNTSWRNVEKAIDSLKRRGVLTPGGMRQLKKSALASMIRPSGYYRIKADRLMAFVDFLWENYEGKVKKMGKEPLNELREQLLKVKGIGPETADSILLYGVKKPVFVVDAYTKRIFSRHGIISEKASYDHIQRLFTDHLPHDEKLFNEYHALIVQVGKALCKKTPKCGICPLYEVQNANIKIQI
jgi:endonuclease-3 related protein